MNPEFMNTVMNDMVTRWLDEGRLELDRQVQGQDGAGLGLDPQGLGRELTQAGLAALALAPALGPPVPSGQPAETKVNGDITLPSVPSVPGTALNQTMDETMMTAASPDLLAEPALATQDDMNID